MKTVKEESSDSFDEESLDVEEIYKIPQIKEGWEQEEPLDLMSKSNPRVNSMKVTKIGKNLKGRKRKRLRLLEH